MDTSADTKGKVEEVQDDEDLDPTIKSPEPANPGSVTSVAQSASASSSSGMPGKRGRGRPRKYPQQSKDTSMPKVAKGRSKTGCITCRRRKKKCDETKPECLNCQKNAVVCEGYLEKTVWQSGKQKMEPAQVLDVRRPRSLPYLIDGIEDDIDRQFLEHFASSVSRILTLMNDDMNPFKKILLPMAIRHRGLMHSLLCLAGSHLALRDQKFSERRLYHWQEAVRHLTSDPNMRGQAAGTSKELVDDPTVATTIVLCLNSLCAGEIQGEYRPHLNAARHLVVNQQSGDQQFNQFLFELYTYHDVLGSVTSLDWRPLFLNDDFIIPEFIVQPTSGALLGVLDGLFAYISKVTHLRDQVRSRKQQGLDPIDYPILSKAVQIDDGIRSWVPNQPEGHTSYVAALLYRQCTWVYLYRTIQPSRPSPKIAGAVNDGLELLRHLPPDSSAQSVLLMPAFLLGCAAFDPDQRPEISKAFDTVYGYSGLGNIDPARRVVEKIWSLMDAGDEASWDWESLIMDMGLDFLVT